MFSVAYGHLYKSNDEVFRQLYASFRRYYSNGDVNLNEVMHEVWEAHCW